MGEGELRGAVSPVKKKVEYPYIYFWNRMGRKGQRCRVVARAKIRVKHLVVTINGKTEERKWSGGNSRLIEFEDGFKAVTSGNALRKAK